MISAGTDFGRLHRASAFTIHRQTHALPILVGNVGVVKQIRLAIDPDSLFQGVPAFIFVQDIHFSPVGVLGSLEFRLAIGQERLQRGLMAGNEPAGEMDKSVDVEDFDKFQKRPVLARKVISVISYAILLFPLSEALIVSRQDLVVYNLIPVVSNPVFDGARLDAVVVPFVVSPVA
ncbi:MAG: hypothetical protein LBK73_01700 [Treponema sp.]|jgi:hypothetical protein|nr:hypothetical protein [Treponema sp.]